MKYDKRADANATTSWLVRLEEWFGIGGYLSFVILLATIFNALDVIIIYCFIYYGGSFVIMTVKYCKKAICLAKENQDKMLQ